MRYDEFETYLDDANAEIVRAAVARAIATGERQEYVFSANLPSGATSYRQSLAVPTIGADGRVVRLHGTDQDISARKLVDALQQELAHLSRVDAMNAMAATLAHELNQPLTAAANYLVGSRRLLAPADPARLGQVTEGMQLAERQVLLAAKIIKRVRDMVSNQPRVHESSSLSEILADAIGLLSVANSYPQVRVVSRIGGDADQISADSIQVQQVLMNLIRNACEATAAADRPKVTVASRRYGGGHVLVSVSDNGPGIPPAANDLFSPFATSKQNGMGLGLSISRTIVEAHGGRIWVERTGREGTVISFTLPVPISDDLDLETA